jgi:glycosyltransferase involved in cell wall biosynthesis
MKVLVVTHKPPFPKIDGGCLATAQIISGLEKLNIDYQIALISTNKHPFEVAAFPEAIQTKIAVHHFLNTANFFTNLKNFCSSRASIFSLRFYDVNFLKKLIDLCDDFQPDIVHFESFFAAVYLDDLQKNCKAKMVVRTHNIEHQLWRDRFKKANRLISTLLSPQVQRLKAEELETFKKLDGIVAIAKNELEFLSENAIQTPAVLIPTGIQLSLSQSGYSNDFFHLAAMDWQPNINGLNWFLKEVWSKFELFKTNIIHLAGKNLDKENYREYKGVKNHGMVRDSAEFMCHYGIMLVPLREGSGLRIKIIEAGALGVPIIATSKAVEGIGLVPNVHYLQANDPNDFQNAMQLLANNVSLRQSIGTAIRGFMQQNYNQDIFNNQLIEFYQSI